ncbi:MAG: RNA methyltransferase [Microscillaceae bacterium]|nr:RNA methyltransferase [Microscillaceae bacterium]
MQNQKLWEYLEGYLTEHKKNLFRRVLADRTRHFTVVIEDIYREHNAGALVRTCDCFGIQDIHIIEQHYSFHVLHNIAKGSERWLDYHLYQEENKNNTLDCIAYLKSQNYQIVATTPHLNECLLEDFDIRPKSAFFFGGEKEGLSQEVIKQADVFLKIPVLGFTESFNVSVAAAIILYSLTQKLRQRDDIPWQLTPTEVLDKKIDWAISSIPHGEKIRNYYFEKIAGQSEF